MNRVCPPSATICSAGMAALYLLRITSRDGVSVCAKTINKIKEHEGKLYTTRQIICWNPASDQRPRRYSSRASSMSHMRCLIFLRYGTIGVGSPTLLRNSCLLIAVLASHIFGPKGGGAQLVSAVWTLPATFLLLWWHRPPQLCLHFSVAGRQTLSSRHM